MMNAEAPIIVGLDIGTTKIAAIAGRKNEYNKLKYHGIRELRLRITTSLN